MLWMREVFVSALGVNKSYYERVGKTLIRSFGARVRAADEVRYPGYQLFQRSTLLDRVFDLLRGYFWLEFCQHNMLDQLSLLTGVNLTSRPWL